MAHDFLILTLASQQYWAAGVFEFWIENIPKWKYFRTQIQQARRIPIDHRLTAADASSVNFLSLVTVVKRSATVATLRLEVAARRRDDGDPPLQGVFGPQEAIFELILTYRPTYPPTYLLDLLDSLDLLTYLLPLSLSFSFLPPLTRSWMRARFAWLENVSILWKLGH